jgi:hypothetical protein
LWSTLQGSAAASGGGSGDDSSRDARKRTKRRERKLESGFNFLRGLRTMPLAEIVDAD